MHTHGDRAAPDHSHGGSGRGLGWELLDTIVATAAIAIVCILSEILFRAWQERRAQVRYDLTPEGAAATRPDVVQVDQGDEQAPD